ncbi:hypothetical protein KA005_44345, partial [bacterium]|nr:hypothetical protein [bacterium]
QVRVRAKPFRPIARIDVTRIPAITSVICGRACGRGSPRISRLFGRRQMRPSKTIYTAYCIDKELYKYVCLPCLTSQ